MGEVGVEVSHRKTSTELKERSPFTGRTGDAIYVSRSRKKDYGSNTQ